VAEQVRKVPLVLLVQLVRKVPKVFKEFKVQLDLLVGVGAGAGRLDRKGQSV
jgi:hypothetical protein